MIDLVSHTTYVVYVNFIHKWLDLQFKVDSERLIFGETFHGTSLLKASNDLDSDFHMILQCPSIDSCGNIEITVDYPHVVKAVIPTNCLQLSS